MFINPYIQCELSAVLDCSDKISIQILPQKEGTFLLQVKDFPKAC